MITHVTQCDLSTAGTIHGVQNFGLAQKIDGSGKVELRYAPDYCCIQLAGDKATGSGGGSGMEVRFFWKPWC